jgi:hypothetical protein
VGSSWDAKGDERATGCEGGGGEIDCSCSNEHYSGKSGRQLWPFPLLVVIFLLCDGTSVSTLCVRQDGNINSLLSKENICARLRWTVISFPPTCSMIRWVSRLIHSVIQSFFFVLLPG